MAQRLTIGMLASWQVYEGTTIGRYLHTLLHGIRAGAADNNCHLLLACGIGALPGPRAYTTAWPDIADDADFVPVGPWNCSGLIVVPHNLTDAQSCYLRGLLDVGYPLVFVGPEEPGPAVYVDNADGIRQAFEHLRAHGHTRIAFIAGYNRDRGDSAVRLQAYRDALHQAGFGYDPRLVAYSGHNVHGGKRAMQQVLATSADFTAVLASNDLAAFGVVAALRDVGRSVPEDVALIGFDDILDAKSYQPPLTTIRHPTYSVGYQSVALLLDRLNDRANAAPVVQIPTQLVVRQSCGCGLGEAQIASVSSPSDVHSHDPFALVVQSMAQGVVIETRYGDVNVVIQHCQQLAAGWRDSLNQDTSAPFDQALSEVLQYVDALDEDPHAWQAAISELHYAMAALLPSCDSTVIQSAERLLHRARLAISERTRRLATRALVHHMDVADELGLMSAQLLAAFEESQIFAILAAHLPRVGVRSMVIVILEADGDDPVALGRVLLCYGLPHDHTGLRFASRHFPPPGLYPAEGAYQLALLPLGVQGPLAGFVAFDAAHLEPCAAIVRNLASALRTSRLYREAREGQRQAEAANRLKSRFLSMVSHELRTPLNVIVGLSEMVLREQEQALEFDRDAVIADVARIHHNSQHLGRLISDVLDLTSSEAGQLQLVRELLDLSDVLQVVALTGADMAGAKGLQWHADLTSPGPQVLGDRTRLRQVVLNLLANAVKFTDAGAVTLRVDTAGEYATIEVMDTGLGIPVDEQVTIFSEFRRSERTATRGFGGMGLGLAICKQFVELHGGTITVRSAGQLNSGSSFYVTLPLLATTPAAATEPGSAIMILAGHSSQAELIRMRITTHGLLAEILLVDDTGDWLMQLLGTPPRAILLDDELAARQGWEIVAALKRQTATAQLPVLICAFDTATDRGALLELMALSKPLRADQIAQVLTQQGLLDSSEATPRILIVDDDPDTLDLHTRLVQQQRANVRVLRAVNGRLALDIMHQQQPDLVMLDLMMPELDGFGVLAAMRNSSELRDIPVVVLTAQELSADDMARLNQGVAAILSKGLFTSTEIVSHLEAALAGNRRAGGASQRIVRQALEYMHTHASAPLSREQIARHVSITEDHLTNCFHEVLAITPMTYLNRYRLKLARVLLEADQRSITDVALAVGFSDSAYFSRVFLREVGVSPSAYRRGVRPATNAAR